MKYLLGFAFLLVFVMEGSAQGRTDGRFSEKEIAHKLDSARSGKTVVVLSRFFAEWNSLSKSIDPGPTGQNDTIRAVYEVFRSFYKPLDLLKLGNWEWGNRLNENARFVAVQNSISYAVLLLDTPRSGEESGAAKPDLFHIFDFRPSLDIDASRVLYLFPEYEEAMNQFLGAKSTAVGAGGIMNPSFPEGESENRYKLLRPWLPILHGHWGGYWHLETHPYVARVLFNRQMNLALLEFRVGYQGGECLLEKKAGRWNIKDSHATWIE
jgi:hypothetical protein